MRETDEIAENLAPRWRRHVAGLGHVSRNTASTFVRLAMPGESFPIRDQVAEALFDIYCDDAQAGRHEADLAVQVFSEDL